MLCASICTLKCQPPDTLLIATNIIHQQRRLCVGQDAAVFAWSCASPSLSLSSISCDVNASALMTSLRSFLTNIFAENTLSFRSLESGSRAYVSNSLSAHSPILWSLSAFVCHPGVVSARCCFSRYSMAYTITHTKKCARQRRVPQTKHTEVRKSNLKPHDLTKHSHDTATCSHRNLLCLPLSNFTIVSCFWIT